MTNPEYHYSANNTELRILKSLEKARLDPNQVLTPEDIAALDHFHIGGIQAAQDLLYLASIQSNEKVLDIGARHAGSARLITLKTRYTVECIQMSSDYCKGAELLDGLTGLEKKDVFND